jgi:Flp pilus assembly protein TadD
VRAQIVLAPNNSSFYLLLGQLLLNAKDTAGAETAVQKAVDLDPNDVATSLFLAQLELQQGSTDKAAIVYQQVLQKNPGDIRPYIGLASLDENSGNWQQAQKLYQQALAIKPDDPAAANNLAFLMIDHGGDKDTVMSLAQTARRGLPNVPNTADTLGWAQYYHGWYPSAVSTLQTAVKDAPDNPGYHYHLGLAYQKTGDSTHAKEQFNLALGLHPSPQQADEIHKALGG